MRAAVTVSWMELMDADLRSSYAALPSNAARRRFRDVFLLAVRRRRDGCADLRVTRIGLLVGLYRSAEAGIEDEEGHGWSTVCEAHGGVVCHRTRRLAETHLLHPEEWCPDCAEARP